MTSKISALLGVIFVLVLSTDSAFAQSFINVGQAFGWLEPYINSIVAALITVAVGWVLYTLKNKLNISIDDSMRLALETFLKNQAASLVADGAVKLKGTQINVSSPALAAAANSAGALIPDTMNHFGLTPEVIQAKIVDALPHVPAVAQAQAQVLAKSPAA